MNGMETLEIKNETTMDNQKDLELANNEYKYTKEDICSICNVGHAAFERFAPSLLRDRDFISVGSSHKKMYTEQVLQKFQAWLLRNQANQGRASDTIKSIVKAAIKNEETNWYSVKEICDICNTSRQTWINFKNEFNCKIDFTVKRNLREGDKNVDYYPEKTLEAFQTWLMKNQANQGRSSEVVKQATMDNLEIGVAANYVMSSGSIEAAHQFAQLLISRTEAIAKSKQLESENQQLVHALEYDEVKDWKPWNELKSDWKQYFELLRHKINYTKLFDEVGLVENEDYKKKVMGFDKFPTVLISPEAEDMLWDWLDGHN